MQDAIKEYWEKSGEDEHQGALRPVWKQDSDHCDLCGNKFTMSSRRHHCRLCGKCVCNNCSKGRIKDKKKDNKQIRVCDPCHLTHLEDSHDSPLEHRKRINSIYEGYLIKRGGRIQTWKRRYHVLMVNKLEYYKDINAKFPLGEVPLPHGTSVTEVEPLLEDDTYNNSSDDDDPGAPSTHTNLSGLTIGHQQTGSMGFIGANLQPVVGNRLSGSSHKRSITSPADLRKGSDNKVRMGSSLTMPSPRNKKKESVFSSLRGAAVNQSVLNLRGGGGDESRSSTSEKDMAGVLECQFFITIPHDDRVYGFQADTKVGREKWVACINNRISAVQVTAKKERSSVKEGYLFKMGGKHKAFQKRYFVLTAKNMKYYKDVGDAKPAGTINLEKGVSLVEEKTEDGAPDQFAFTVTPTKSKRRYALYTETEEEREAWLDAIRGRQRLAKEQLEKKDEKDSPKAKDSPKIPKGGISVM